MTKQIVNKLDCSVCKKNQSSDVAIVAGSGFNICSKCVDLIKDTDPLSKWAHGICMFCGQVSSEPRSMVPGSDYAFCPSCTKLLRAMTGKAKESKAMSSHCTYCQNSQPLALFAGIDPGVAVCGECMQLCKELGSDADVVREATCILCGKDHRYGKILSYEQLRICQRCLDGTMHTKTSSQNLKPLMETLLPKSLPAEAPQPSTLPTLGETLVDQVETIESRLARVERSLEVIQKLPPRTERVESLDKVMPDPEDLDYIRKLVRAEPGVTGMLSREASYELARLLHELDSRKGILGSLVVGHDGVLLASTIPNGHDAISVGVAMLGLFMNAESCLRRMGQERVYQIVTQTEQGHVVIADFGGGLLVTIGDGSDSPIYRKQATDYRKPSPPSTPSFTLIPTHLVPSTTQALSVTLESEEQSSSGYSYSGWIKKNRERINAAIYKLQQSQTDE